MCAKSRTKTSMIIKEAFIEINILNDKTLMSFVLGDCDGEHQSGSGHTQRQEVEAVVSLLRS